MAALSFFVGKGGVGKTTVSSAYAVHTAVKNPRRRVLLLSTDPAHSLADVFQLRFSDRPTTVKLARAAKLQVWQLDPQKQFQKFLDRYRDGILRVVESGTMFTREEIEPLLDTTLPGMAEMAALLAIREALNAGKHHEIVVDTAPIGHTLRLFQMPQHFLRFLRFLDAAGSRDTVLAQHFGGHASPKEAFVIEWREMVEEVQAALHAEESKVVLVTTPEKFSLEESVRTMEALRTSAALAPSQILMNRLVTTGGKCPRCRSRAVAAKSAAAFLKRKFPRIPVAQGQDGGSPLLGVRDLQAFGAHVFAGKKLSATAAPAAKPPKLEPAEWPASDVRLLFTVGKGGVGKTTVSAGLAFHRRAAARVPVVVCSTDPAPSLDDIFEKPIGGTPVSVLGDKGLRAMELDSVAEFQKWSRGMKGKIADAFSGQSGGLHIDLSYDREVFSALLDIVPPGVDEIFAVLRIVDLLEDRDLHAIIDMAPTGHALELLQMPGRMLVWSRLLLKSLAPHRTVPLAQDVAVEIASVGQRVRLLVQRLADAEQSQVNAVMLAEPLPDRETQRLLKSLKGLNLPAGALFINRVLSPEDARGCQRCTRAARWQWTTLRKLKRAGPGREIFIIPEQPDEVHGKAALQRLTASLWRLE